MQCTQAILPVAGLGTRFLPWTKVVPKELLPIGNRPIIALLVDECLSVGIEDICFVISRGKEAIPQYFQSVPSLERELERRGKTHLLGELARYDNVRFTVRYQDEQLGDGHAILQAYDWVERGTISVLFGDDLIIGAQNGLEQLLDAGSQLTDGKTSCVLGLENVAPERVPQYGIVDVGADWSVTSRMHRIRGLVEKPSIEEAPSTLGIIGRYLIPSELFPMLRSLERGSKDGEIRLIDALIAANGSMEIYGRVLDGVRLDTGTPAGYRDAVRFLNEELPVTLTGVLEAQAA